MDWIDEKLENFRLFIRNLPVKKALIVYLCLAALLALVLSGITIQICEKWIDILAEKQVPGSEYVYAEGVLLRVYKSSGTSSVTGNDTKLHVLQEMSRWCPYLYTVSGMLFSAGLFYRKRLKKPFGILEEAVDKIRGKDLDFEVFYKSKDEMGRLCGSFEEMRKNLEKNQKEMWNLVEEQKQLNAAFAHDLRTPLTVIRGYSDFLIRYLPKGTISREKLRDTLILLSEQAERLERFSGTMKSLRSVEEIPFSPSWKNTGKVEEGIQGMVDALNIAKEVEIHYRHETDSEEILLDEDILLEVLDNLLSNAIRYAKKRVEIETREEGDRFYLFVSDDGPGFSEEALENASGLYFSEGKKEEHFGIGLTLSDLLCRKHGGDLSFANNVRGHGAIASASFQISSQKSKEILPDI